MMSESARQYYLGRAGIRLWYARESLPGAAPSPEFRLPSDDSTPEPEPQLMVPSASPPSTQRPVADGSGRRRIAGLQALMTGAETGAPEVPEPESAVELPASDAVGSSVSVSPAPDNVAESDQQTRIEAHLGFWVSGQLVLVSSISDQASERLQGALAENILASLGESATEECRHVRWPVFGNSRVPGNSPDDFHGLLRAVSSEFGSRKLLLLGVLVDDIPAGRAEWLASALGTPAVDFSRSLAELAAVPMYKRELWQKLKSAIGA